MSEDQAVELPVELKDMFAVTARFDDAAAFETKTLRRLSVRLWLRQWLVVMAGMVGGVYALFQFVRVPEGTQAAATPLHQVQVDTSQSLQAGVRLFDAAGQHLSGLTQSGVHYLDMVQTPLFFWLSFAVCMSLLGLYYAYSREETL
ncbi:MAG: hypothetical protein ACXU8U_08960 [Asticcacaulis sp.]